MPHVKHAADGSGDFRVQGCHWCCASSEFDPKAAASGRHPGGNGMIRAIEFRAPLTLSLLTSRRTTQPFGLNGGGPGATGENWLSKQQGQRLQLPSQYQTQVDKGDKLEIYTPGGGGYGSR